MSTKDSDTPAPMPRRRFLKKSALAAAAVMVSSPAKAAMTFEQFFQKHYRDMTPEEKERVLKRIAAQMKAEYGVDAHVVDVPPLSGVQFAYFLNLLKCNGNRKCVEACKKENNQDTDIAYIQVIQMDKGHFN